MRTPDDSASRGLAVNFRTTDKARWVMPNIPGSPFPPVPGRFDVPLSVSRAGPRSRTGPDSCVVSLLGVVIGPDCRCDVTGMRMRALQLDDGAARRDTPRRTGVRLVVCE